MSMSDLKFRHPDRIFPGTLRTCGRILSRNYSKFLSVTIVLGVKVIQVSNISVIMLFKRDQRFLENFQQKIPDKKIKIFRLIRFFLFFVVSFLKIQKTFLNFW